MVPPEESRGYRNVSGSVRMVGKPEVEILVPSVGVGLHCRLTMYANVSLC